jgi:hypothetical protein
MRASRKVDPPNAPDVSEDSCYIQPAWPALSGLASEVVLSPILVRPVREQLEHDRVIRLLQAKYKRKYDVAINPGNEQTMPVGSGASAWYPDLVLQSSDRAHKLAGIVEVETAESVNNLEAMSQWATFARLRVPFHLYLPTASVDSARRFCIDLSIPVDEIWAYQSVGDQLRFTLVQRASQSVDRDSRGRSAEPETRSRAVPRRAVPESTRAAKPLSRRASTPARSRSNGQGAAPARPGRPAGAVANRLSAGKSKAATLRRPAAGKNASPRKAKASSSSSRAQKRR